MTQIDSANLPIKVLVEEAKNSDLSQVKNAALKKILEETSEEGKKPDIIQAYDRMYHTHNRG